MEIKKEKITPVIAETYLKRNNPSNRKPKRHHIEAMAQDMRRGLWEEDNPQNMIVFDKNNVLKDGQNRLMAIIKAGVPVNMFVCTGVSPDVHIFDKAVMRSTADTLVIGGMDRGFANNVTVAITRFMFGYVYGVLDPMTDEKIRSYIERFGGDLQMAYSVSCIRTGKTSIVKKAPVQTAFYTAIRYGIPEEELREFTKVCVTGLQDYPWQTPAILLRNHIQSEFGLLGKPKERRCNLYKIASKAIWDYHNHIRRKQRYDPAKIEPTVCEKFVVNADKEFIDG